MSCPSCGKAAAVMFPVFRFRRERFLDRFFVSKEDRKVAGLVKVWDGYHCECPNCGLSFRITSMGTVNLNAGRKPEPAEKPIGDPPPKDEEPVMPFTLDDDMVLPGRPPRR